MAAHTRDSLVESIVGDYYSAQLPEQPAARVGVLRDIVFRTWSALPMEERVALAEEFDDADAVTAFAERAPHLDAHELKELDEQAVDGLTDLIRNEIPELSVPEF